MHVTLLLTDHCSAASASIALEMLTAATLLASSATPPFEVVSASLDGADGTCLGGQRLQVNAALAELAHTELVLTTTVTGVGRYLSRKTDVYYVEESDTSLFASMKADPSAINVTTMKVVAQ